MRLLRFRVNRFPDIVKLHWKLVGEKLTNENVAYVLLDTQKKHPLGYCVLEKQTDTKIKIDWIYCPSCGKELYTRIEDLVRTSGFSEIVLNCSIDETESKEAVMKRLNFYIGLQYRVFDIKYRPQIGPLLYMIKRV